MASNPYTATVRKQGVMGNERYITYEVASANAASGMIQTTLGYVDWISVSPVSAVTAAYRAKPNLNDSSAAANGAVFLSSVTTGDDFYVTVYGRS